MSNISNFIKQHNWKMLSTKNVDWLFNCRNKDSCPLDGKCLQTCIAYKADVITNKGSHIYYGASDGEFISVQYPHKFISQSISRARYWTFKSYLATTRQRHQFHPKMENLSWCLDMQMWVKKVWPLFNGEVRNSKSWSDELTKKKTWVNCKVSP